MIAELKSELAAIERIIKVFERLGGANVGRPRGRPAFLPAV